MTNDQDVFPDHYTFAQRYGYEPLPEAMKLDFLSRDLRRELCNEIEALVGPLRSGAIYGYFSPAGEHLFRSTFGEYEVVPNRKVQATKCSQFMDKVEFVMMEVPCYGVLKFLEILVRHAQVHGLPASCKTLPKAIQGLLVKHSAAYRLVGDKGKRFWFYPCDSDAHAKAIAEAIETLENGGFEAARTHLRRAAEHINDGRHENAVAESIHAVESVARSIDPDASTTLTPALKSLQAKGLLTHPALRQSFEKLYGYTNDEQGIRHALIDSDQANVGVDESVFMFGACASFSGYLVRKYLSIKSA